MCPLSECLLEVDMELEDFMTICNGRLGLEVESSKVAGGVSPVFLPGMENNLEVESSKEASLEVGVASLVLAENENDLEDARAVGPECNQAASPARQRLV